jgi:hypothetical protein
MSKEKYNQVIDETYLNYRNAFVEGHVHQELDKCLSQEEFVQQIKTDDEFAKIWGIKQTVVQLIIQALDIECKSRGMNVNWDMYLEMEKKQRIKDKLELSASWAKSREQTRETAMHIGFAKGFMSGLECYEDYYEELNRTQLDEDEFTRNYITDRFEETQGGINESN